jgi:hypothetical protein
VWADVVLWYLDGSTWRVLARKAFWSNSTIQRNAFIVGGVNLANATVSGVKFTHYRATDGRDWPLPATSYSVQTVLTWYAMNAMGSTRWVGQRTVAYQHASDYVGLGQVGINAGSCRLLV